MIAFRLSFMRLPRVTPFVFLLLAPALSVRGADVPPQRLEDAAKRLGSPDARVRDEAAETLRAAGPAAEPALRAAAAEGGNPEAARRATALLRQTRQPGLEEPPDVEPPEARVYRGADRESKVQIIERLGTGYRATALVRLWKEEEDGELRAAMFNAMARAPGAFATALLADGNAPAAERLLDAALAQGNTEAAAPYAALCLARGRVEDAVTKWSARLARPRERRREDGDGGEADALAAAVLARLRRAAGDLPAAVAAARRAGDPPLLEETLLAAGDWPALAEVVAKRQAPVVRPKQLGLLAGAHHLAGNAPAFDAVIARMRNLAKPESLNDVAEVLLLTGRADEGMRVLEGGGGATAAARVKLLAAQERWDDAWALVAAHDAALDEPAIRLRVAAAEQWHGLGEHRQAAELFARAADDAKALGSADVFALLGETHRRVGNDDAAWGHFRSALKAATDRKADAGRVVWLAFQMDLDRDGEPDVNGSSLWDVVAARVGERGVDAQFDRARSIVDRTLPLDELKAMAADGPQSLRAHAAGLPAIVAHRLKDEGRDDEAERYLAAAAERAPSPEHALQAYLRLGDWAAARRDWAKAGNFYGRAWNADRSRSAPLYLRAWALREAGWHARAGELTRLAHALPLADHWRRHEAMKVLHERRLDAALAGEIDVILRTARPDMMPADLAKRLRADRAARDGDWLGATALHERSALNFMAVYDLADPAMLLRVADTVRRLRAKGLLAKGDVEAAEREIAACRAALPGDVMMPIDVIPEFERLGDKARADALYAEAMAAQDAVLAKHPNSAEHHNSAAWLAVTCGRDGDKALAHARRAVELHPDRAAYLDTLAEVLFRRGEIDEATKAMTKCVALEPRTPRHHEQLERFDAARRGEQRPMPPG